MKFDKVYHKGQYCFIKGIMSSGYMILMDIHSNKIDFKPIPKPSTTKRISARKSVMNYGIYPSKSLFCRKILGGKKFSGLMVILSHLFG
jgi:hypothetical protein